MTALPYGVRVEADIAEGVVLWDVSGLLPRAHRRATARPRGVQILRLYLHNSGALGLPGVAGAVASARFVMRERGFPWWPYHFWLCRDAPVTTPADSSCCVSPPTRSARGRRVRARTTTE